MEKYMISLRNNWEASEIINEKYQRKPNTLQVHQRPKELRNALMFWGHSLQFYLSGFSITFLQVEASFLAKGSEVSWEMLFYTFAC